MPIELFVIKDKDLGEIRFLKYPDGALVICFRDGWMYAKYNVEDQVIKFGHVPYPGMTEV